MVKKERSMLVTHGAHFKATDSHTRVILRKRA